jgi:hypothetical protein
MRSAADMKKRLPLFSSHLSVCITEHELYSFEEVAFSRSIAPNDDVVPRGEGLGNSLVLVTMSAEWSTIGTKALSKASAHLLKPCIMICLMYILDLVALNRGSSKRS